MSKGIFPFELIIKDGEGKELFVQTVEKVLQENLQCQNSFGCRISDCHMHIGSKKHLSSFIEAELLFHNSYYNKGFAFCTVELIRKIDRQYSKIMLVGYETFSELYICETVEMLRKKTDKEIEYCIAETVSEKFRIRTNAPQDFWDKNVFYVFIVAINTTLTTHDKLLNSFQRWTKDRGLVFNKQNSINVGLIMIAPDVANDYWKVVSIKERIIKLKKEKQSELPDLGEKLVYYFASVNGNWYNYNECVHCFPDLKNKSLVEEQAIFEVNRASVVPMLQLGMEVIPEPLDYNTRKKENNNIQKLLILNKHLIHRHIVRNSNHYQYYFDTQNFFMEARGLNNYLNLGDWLELEVKNEIQKKNRGKEIIYNFIVAPRHYSNAGFVQLVNDIVFEGSARILYFDVNKEYRENIKAKYSDLTRLEENIINSGQPSKLCFHYVDDVIFSGTNYLRTKNLLYTLISNGTNTKLYKKSLFESVILLIGRNSNDSKKWFGENESNFYEYVHLSISPMRNHEDACTLCKLEKSFEKIKTLCATNEIAEYTQETINSHKKVEISNFDIVQNPTEDEKKARVLIKHLLAERLRNNWWGEHDEKVINSEKTEDIYYVIKYFYGHLDELLFETICKENDIQIDYSVYESTYNKRNLQIALIKVISRPFFCYHIRKKQAALRFCLELLSEMLSNNKIKRKMNSDEAKVFKVLINALADLNATYLIRAETIGKVLYLIRKNQDVLNPKDYYRAIKKVISMSNDNSKSLLLEHILIEKSEKNFFGRSDFGGKLGEIEDEEWFTLYLENNSVLIEGFKNPNLSSWEKGQGNVFPYYLEKFYQIIKLNWKEKDEEDIDRLILEYRSIYSLLTSEMIGTDGLKELAYKIEQLFNGLPVKVFFKDKGERVVYDGYYLLNEEVDEVFYRRDRLDKIEMALKNEPILETIYINNEQCIIKFLAKNDKTIYFALPYIEKSDIKDWFLVKVLLTLRNEFVDMLNKLNVINEINKLNIERKKKALAIRKAHSHYSMEYFEGKQNLQLHKKEEVFNGNSNAYLLSKKMYDNYILFLSNEFISEMYRKIIYYPNKICYKGIRIYERLKEELEVAGFNSNKEGKMVYVLNTPNEEYESVPVKIVCDIESFRNKKFWFLARGEALIPYYYLIMIAFAANAGMHYRGGIGKVCQLNVKAEGNYIVFKNRISNIKLTEQEKDRIIEAAKNKMETPPWEFVKDEQSITLWSFSRYFEILYREYANYEKNERGRKCPQTITEGKGIFIKIVQDYFVIGLELLEEI